MYHCPVLVDQIIASIPADASTIIDGTFGHGGHSLAISTVFPQATIYGIDRDQLMIQKAKERLGNNANINILHGSYADIVSLCHSNGIFGVDYILLDIGVNMDHFADRSRGFSVHESALLDMRFDTKQSITAHSIVNTHSLSSLQHIFHHYGDFSLHKSEEIGMAIIKSRKENPIQTTDDLRNILGSCGLGKNAAIVIFQSLRIAVNQELQQLEQFLDQFDAILHPGGRCAIISYHSIEDRIVKQSFKNRLASQTYIAIHKKAIKPSRKEIEANRAARSAVLRIIEKTH